MKINQLSECEKENGSRRSNSSSSSRVLDAIYSRERVDGKDKYLRCLHLVYDTWRCSRAVLIYIGKKINIWVRNEFFSPPSSPLETLNLFVMWTPSTLLPPSIEENNFWGWNANNFLFASDSFLSVKKVSSTLSLPPIRNPSPLITIFEPLNPLRHLSQRVLTKSINILKPTTAETRIY